MDANKDDDGVYHFNPAQPKTEGGNDLAQLGKWKLISSL
jgi:hypothetical protein